MTLIKDLRAALERKKGQRHQIQKDLRLLKQELKKKKTHINDLEKAREIVKFVGLETQKQLQFHISDIATVALDTVFDNPYELKVDFVERRNKTECDITFQRGDLNIDPLTASGVGAVDVAAFALRVASWSMRNPRSRPVLILDEPFKHLKGKRENLRVLEMIKEISTKLQLQIIMVSDERIDRNEIIEHSDRVFEASMIKGVTKIKELK